MEIRKKSGLIIITLVLIDQLTKIIINSHFKEISFKFLNGKLGFNVYLNTEYMSVYNHNFNLNLSIGVLIFISIAILLFLVSYYMYVIKNNALNSKIRFCMILVIAATLCSLIDRVFWGGSLDFIVFFGYIIDFKDIFLYFGVLVGIILFIYEYVIMKRNVEKAEVLSLKGYINFMKNML